jgi:ribokinase
MGRVVSLGSINVDRVWRIDAATLDTLTAQYDWFPGQGETVSVDGLPEGFPDCPGEPATGHGGKGANQAVAAARAGADAAMLGAVGPDSGRVGSLDALAGEGVAVDGVRTVRAPTGTAHVFVDSSGGNRIVVSPGANGTVDRDYVEGHLDTVLDADCLLLQNEIPAEPVAALLAALADEPDRPTVLLDPAPPAGVAPLLAAGPVDVLTPNEREYERLRPALDGFDGVCLRTRGPRDVLVDGADGFAVTPPRVEAVDTTGAGDTFAGVLAAQLADGAGWRAAVGTATVAAALSTRDAGARTAPTLEAVRRFRASPRGTNPDG